MAIHFPIDFLTVQNMLNIGNYEDEINIINNNVVAPHRDKAIVFLSYLSRAHELNGQFKGECISFLESKIFEYFSTQPAAVKEAVTSSRFAHNHSLEKVVQKITYMAKTRFVSNSENYFVKGTKFSHHLDRIFKSLSGSSAGVGIGLVTVGALSFAYRGISDLLPSSGNDAPTAKKSTAIPVIIVGATLAIAPLLEAVIKSGSSEPE